MYAFPHRLVGNHMHKSQRLLTGDPGAGGPAGYKALATTSLHKCRDIPELPLQPLPIHIRPFSTDVRFEGPFEYS